MMMRNKQSGQAIMELMVLLLSFIICFLGLLLVMGFSITNIEIFLDAKFNAEKNAQFSDYGGDGLKNDDFRNWKYTEYAAIDYPIPFLPKDEPVGIQTDLENKKNEFNNPVYSNSGDKYTFNNFSVITPDVAQNIPYDTPSLSYLTANLIKGKSFDFQDENNALITDKRYFQREQFYDACERIIGIKELKNINLEDNYTNIVLFPALKVLDTGSE